MIDNPTLLIILAERLIPWFLGVHLPSDPEKRKYYVLWSLFKPNWI